MRGEKKRMSILVLTSIVVLILALVYISDSIWICIQTDRLLNAIYESYGKYDEQYLQVISTRLYDKLNYRMHNRILPLTDAIEINKRTFPIVWHNFHHATALFWYTYEYKGSSASGDEKAYGSWNIPVKIYLTFSNWKWIVVDVYEAP